MLCSFFMLVIKTCMSVLLVGDGVGVVAGQDVTSVRSNERYALRNWITFDKEKKNNSLNNQEKAFSKENVKAFTAFLTWSEEHVWWRLTHCDPPAGSTVHQEEGHRCIHTCLQWCCHMIHTSDTGHMTSDTGPHICTGIHHRPENKLEKNTDIVKEEHIKKLKSQKTRNYLHSCET